MACMRYAYILIICSVLLWLYPYCKIKIMFIYHRHLHNFIFPRDGQPLIREGMNTTMLLYNYCTLFFAEEYFLSDLVFNDPIPPEYLSHKQKYEEAVRKACHVFKKIQEYQEAHDGGGMQQFRYFISRRCFYLDISTF